MISANFGVYCQQIQVTFKYLGYSGLFLYSQMNFLSVLCVSGYSVLDMQTLTSSDREELTLVMLCRAFLKSESFYWISTDSEPVQ